jgi:hypothetical protein
MACQITLSTELSCQPKLARYFKTEPTDIEVDTAAGFFAGVKNCTDSVHKFSRAFLLCYEFVQFLTPAKQLAAVSPYSTVLFWDKRKHYFQM